MRRPSFTPNRLLTPMPKHAAYGPLRTAVAAAVLGAVAVTSCTDLNESPPSRITPSTFFQNDAQIQAALAGVYNGLRSSEPNGGGYWEISQVSSDETIVPTRGTDWDDGGQWRELWTRSFGPASGAGTQNINGAYSSISSQIAKANAVIDALGTSKSAAAQSGTAEARALRAWFYYTLQDAFGGVPIITKTGVSGVPRATRDSTIRFILSELYAVRNTLPTSYSGGYGRITQGAVDAILANLYLNYHVFTGTPAANGITFNTTTRYDSVLAVTSRIMNSGQYTLAPDFATFRANFTAGNSASKENIFVVRNSTTSGLGLNYVQQIAHYNHFGNPGGWNGFSVLSEQLNQYDPADQRRTLVLTGQQYQFDNPTVAVKTRAGAPLILGDIQSLTAAAEGDGYRAYKYPLDPNHNAQDNGNDYVIFRLSGVMLDRAEALYKTGDQGSALTILNQLRSRAGAPSVTGAITDSVMLRERLLELLNEGKRRQDLIRLGGWMTQKRFQANPTPPYTMLFPIPLTQLQANPALTQNPGYTQ
ncbi:hypothetical protein tb265_22240 [Gemmatimonadetes bacterium T265]|nr:hypothetical protein tb265_22240 [Gemmatimonadetes bacterium T265]